MSEAELLKWKNKYRLYMILHDWNTPKQNCAVCVFREKICPSPYLAVCADGEVEFGHRMYSREWLCAEWVRYV